MTINLILELGINLWPTNKKSINIEEWFNNTQKNMNIIWKILIFGANMLKKIKS